MSHNKLVKTLTDSTTLSGLSAGYGWISKKVIKEPMTSDFPIKSDELCEIHSDSSCLNSNEKIS